MSIWSDRLALIAADASPLAALLRTKLSDFGPQYDAAGASQGVLTESAAHSAWRQQGAAVNTLGERIASSTLPGAAALVSDYQAVRRAVVPDAEPPFFTDRYYVTLRWVGLERRQLNEGVFHTMAYLSYNSPRILPVDDNAVFQFFAGYSAMAGDMATQMRDLLNEVDAYVADVAAE